MEIWVGLICTVIGIVISYATFYINQKSRVKKEVKETTERNVRSEIEIDNLHDNLSETRIVQKEVLNELSKLNEKIALLEQLLGEVEKRVDRLESIGDKKNG